MIEEKLQIMQGGHEVNRVKTVLTKSKIGVLQKHGQAIKNLANWTTENKVNFFLG